MARVSRYRTRNVSLSGTRDAFVDGVPNGTLPVTKTNLCTCYDYHGRPISSGPFTSKQYYLTDGGLRMNGRVTSLYAGGHVSYEYTDYPVGPVSSGVTTTPLPAPSGWTLDLVAGTNPNRPTFVPLTILQDLYDIPRALRDVGRLATKPSRALSPKQLANQQLATQFGWMPLIDDLRKLLDLQHYIQKKNEELHKLYSKGGLRRRIKFGNDTQNSVGTYHEALYGPGNYVDFHYDITVMRRSWATIRWRPLTLPGYHPSEMEYSRKARQLALGLTVSGLFEGLWDLLPWTWIVDWFTNVHKYARAYLNTVPVSYSDMCFMSESSRIYSGTNVSTQGCSNSSLKAEGALNVVEKTRSVSHSVSSGFNMPYLGLFRLSVLGALFVQRMKR